VAAADSVQSPEAARHLSLGWVALSLFVAKCGVLPVPYAGTLAQILVGADRETILLAACSGANNMGPRVTKLQEALTQVKVSLRHSVEVGEARCGD